MNQFDFLICFKNAEAFNYLYVGKTYGLGFLVLNVYHINYIATTDITQQHTYIYSVIY